MDAESGQPIPEARVQIELAGISELVLSDASGAFELRNVPSLPRLRAVARAQTHYVEMRVLPPSTDGRVDLGTIRMIRVDPKNPTKALTGAYFVEREGKLFVDTVPPGSPAERAGFRPGDQVISIAGQKVSGDAKEASALLRANPGVEITVVLQTDEQSPREVRIKRTVP